MVKISFPDVGECEVTIGCDPELFIKETKTGQFVCADGLVPGTKEDPHTHKYGMLQADGMACEFGIRPVRTLDGFTFRIRKCIDYAQDWLDTHHGKGKFSLHIGSGASMSTAEFSEEILEKAPEKAKELGCNPDFNAWKSGEMNETPNAEGVFFRTGAGHIHIGFVDYYKKKFGRPFVPDVDHPEHIEMCNILTKMLDYYIGVPSLCWDTDTKRRRLYGKAGAHRRKPYGIEYRTLSNSWLKHKTLQQYVFKQTVFAIRDLSNGLVPFSEDYFSTQKCIDEGVLSQSFSLVQKFDNKLPKPPKGMKRIQQSA